MFTQYKWTDLLRMQAMKTSGSKAKLDRKRRVGGKLEKEEGGMLYKLLYRVDNVG